MEKVRYGNWEAIPEKEKYCVSEFNIEELIDSEKRYLWLLGNLGDVGAGAGSVALK